MLKKTAVLKWQSLGDFYTSLCFIGNLVWGIVFIASNKELQQKYY